MKGSYLLIARESILYSSSVRLCVLCGEEMGLHFPFTQNTL